MRALPAFFTALDCRIVRRKRRRCRRRTRHPRRPATRARCAAGCTVLLTRGAAVEEKDILQTGAGGFLQVRFTDSSIMSLKEQSQLGVEEYRFSGKPDGQERVAFRLLKGAAIPALSPAQSASNNYEMRTTVPPSAYAARCTRWACVRATASTQTVPRPTRRVRIGARALVRHQQDREHQQNRRKRDRAGPAFLRGER